MTPNPHSQATQLFPETPRPRPSPWLKSCTMLRSREEVLAGDSGSESPSLSPGGAGSSGSCWYCWFLTSLLTPDCPLPTPASSH